MVVSMQRICSIFESRKAFKWDNTVESTDTMACSAELRAVPANQRALWSGGSFSMRSWNWLLPFTLLGVSQSRTSLSTLMIWRQYTLCPSFSVGGRYYANGLVPSVTLYH